MAMDNDFYEKWKKKSSNRKFFTEATNLKEKSSQNKIFSSTAIEEQSESESFSLHLSESYVEETPETAGSQKKEKQINEIILISDSSIDESIFSFDKTSTLLCNKKTIIKERQDNRILESSEDESIRVPIQQRSTEKSRKLNTVLNSPAKQNSRKNVIQESDSEIEQSKVPDIIRETVTESVTLSDRKKKEILQWLSTNFDGSRCGSSCSQESAIASSRKSGLSSGNSSLERLELNFETPNNRGKLSKPSTTEKSSRKYRIDIEKEKQSTIDQYFSKSKKGQLDIVKDKTPGSKHSDKTPVNKMKYNPRKILSELDSNNSGTPNSRNSDKTPMNVRTKQNIIIPESESFESKNQDNSEKILVPESESLGSQNNVVERQIIISESESDDSSDFIKNYKRKLDLNYNTKSSISPTPYNKDIILPETAPLETSSDADILNSSSDTNTKNKENEKKKQAPANTTINTTLNDCADILENLYGTTWRSKAKVLVSATEPKKQTTKKIFNDIQTEKKITFRKQRIDYDSDDSILGKENNLPKKSSQTTSKKLKTKKKIKDSFINDSTTESSPDCSYYTAVSNPVQSQNNPVQPSVKGNDKKKAIEICDSDSETNDETWKIRSKNQRKLSFDSSTNSSTSEFDPEDIVPPKMKSTKIIKKPVNCQATKTKPIKQAEVKVEKNSFLASLSKDVPLANADFRAMTYRVKYKSMKEELCKFLYKLFNEKVFSNQLPSDMSIEWSTRLRGTAGKCYNKQSLKALGKTVRSSRIVLATKIIDSPDRLRDTLIHEMCHAATWLINNVSDGHGSFWKAWAHKAMKTFPELPPISRCHNYEIQTKYTYKCTSCGYSIGRHSKSLDLNRKRCGYCHGTFELLINKVTKDGTVQKKSATQKEPSGFALYVKENYHVVKQSSASIKHAEVMKILGQQFSAVKLTPKPEDRIKNNEDESP